MATKKEKTMPGNTKSRATDTTIEERVQVILQLKLDGAQPWDIGQYVADRERAGDPPWTINADQKPLSERTIRRYMVLTEIFNGAFKKENDHAGKDRSGS